MPMLKPTSEGLVCEPTKTVALPTTQGLAEGEQLAESLLDLAKTTTSLEALNSTVVELLTAQGLTPETVERLEDLAGTLAEPVTEEPIKLSNAEGVITTEGLEDCLAGCYRGMLAGTNALIDLSERYYSEVLAVVVCVLERLQQQRLGVSQLPEHGWWGVTLRRSVTPNTPDDLPDYTVGARRHLERVRWLLTVYYPHCCEKIELATSWLNAIDFTTNDTFDTTFSAIEGIPVCAPPEWGQVEDHSAGVWQTSPDFNGSQFDVRLEDPTALSPAPEVQLRSRILDCGIWWTGPQDGLETRRLFFDRADLLGAIDTTVQQLQLQLYYLRAAIECVPDLRALASAAVAIFERAGHAGDLTDDRVDTIELLFKVPTALITKTQVPYCRLLYEALAQADTVSAIAELTGTELEESK